MTCAGVSTMDGGSGATLTGIYREFAQRVQTYYRQLGKSAGTCYGNRNAICFEPHVGQLILRQMIDDTRGMTLPNGQHPTLDIDLRTGVVGVTRRGTIVSGITTWDGKHLEAKVVVDATEYGDILPLAGAAYRLGKGIGPWTEECGCIQDITYVAIIKRYSGGVPAPLVLRHAPPGYAQVRASFASFVALGGHNDGRYPWSPTFYAGYRGLPDSSNPIAYDASQLTAISRTGLNLANDFPALSYATPGAASATPGSPTLSARYLDDRAYRAQQTCAAKLKTLQYLYYFQHDLGYTRWSIANDEGYDTPYNEAQTCPGIPAEYQGILNQFPPLPYVREGRRGVGVTTLTAAEVNGSSSFADTAAIGDYWTDLHNCKTPANLEPGLDQPVDLQAHPAPGRLFEVPLGALIPQAVDGLVLAEKNLTVSRLAEGAICEQPITMATGQAAGAVAAEAAHLEIQPRSVPAGAVQRDLQAARDMYAFP